MISDEHIVILQSSMQYLPTRLPVIILQRVEVQLSAVREVTVGAVHLCGDKIIMMSYCRDLYGLKKKYFLWILCYLSFSVVSDFDVDFLYL